MTPASLQRCATCRATLLETDRRHRCAACGGLLELEHPAPTESAAALRARFDGRCGVRGPAAEAGEGLGSGVWRFKELVLPTAADVISYPEGNTPLLRRAPIAAWAGLADLVLKHEGHNPTGSFKDRGMTVGVTQARRVGAATVACASTGNTAASLAAYAAQAGMRAVVFVPAGGVAEAKLAQSLAYGATTLAVSGDFDACLALVERATTELGIYLLNSVNPFRIEGQKTIVLEMLQQLAWDPPEWIVLPAGNLGNTAAFGKALREALGLGLIARLPRLAAVQAVGASPFAHSYRVGFRERFRERADTVATAIKIGDPASYERAVRAIRETNGVVTAVSDAEILEAKGVIDGSGVGCEPASAASVAGVRQLVRSAIIRPHDRVVAILTGHILKDTGVLADSPSGVAARAANRPVSVEPTLAAIARAIG